MALTLKTLPLKSQNTYTEFVELNTNAGSVRKHSGLDFVASQGDEVFATHTGLVLKAGNYGTYGNVVVIKDLTTGESTLYSNLENISVSEGQQISFGQKIAEVADSSYIEGAVLHFEVLPQNLTFAIEINPNPNILGIESIDPSLRRNPRTVIRQSLPNFTRTIQVTKQTVAIVGENKDSESQGNLFLINGDAQVEIKSGDGNDVFVIDFSRSSSGQVVIQDPNLDAVFVINDEINGEGKMIFENRNAVPLRDANGNIIEGRWAIEGGYLLDQEGQDLLISSEANEGNQILIKGFFNSTKQDRFGIKLNQGVEQVQSSSKTFTVPNRVNQNILPTGRDGSFALVQNKSDGLYVSRYNSRGAKIATQKVGNKESSQFSSESISTTGQSVIFEDGRIGVAFASNVVSLSSSGKFSSGSSRLMIALFESNGKYLGNKVLDEKTFVGASQETAYNNARLSPSNFFVDKNSGEIFCSYTSGGSTFFNAKVDSSTQQVDFEIQSGEKPSGRSLETRSYTTATLPTKHIVQGTLSGFTIQSPIFSEITKTQITNIDLENSSEYSFPPFASVNNEPVNDSVNVGQNNTINVRPVANGVLVIDGFAQDTEIKLVDFFQGKVEDMADFIIRNSTVHNLSDNYAEDFYGMGTAAIGKSNSLTSLRRRSVDEQDSNPIQYQGLGDEKYVVLNLPNNQKIIFASTSPERFLELVDNFQQSYVSTTSVATSTPTTPTITTTSVATSTPKTTTSALTLPTTPTLTSQKLTTSQVESSTKPASSITTTSTPQFIGTSTSPKTTNSTPNSNFTTPNLNSTPTFTTQNSTLPTTPTSIANATDPTRTASMIFNLTTAVSTIISTTIAPLLSSTSSQEETTTALATISPNPNPEESASRNASASWIIPVAVLASVATLGFAAYYFKKRSNQVDAADLERGLVNSNNASENGENPNWQQETSFGLQATTAFQPNSLEILQRLVQEVQPEQRTGRTALMRSGAVLETTHGMSVNPNFTQNNQRRRLTPIFHNAAELDDQSQNAGQQRDIFASNLLPPIGESEQEGIQNSNPRQQPRPATASAVHRIRRPAIQEVAAVQLPGATFSIDESGDFVDNDNPQANISPETAAARRLSGANDLNRSSQA